jgi:hypothetical protein
VTSPRAEKYRAELRRLLVEIERVLPAVTWEPLDRADPIHKPTDPTMVTYQGVTEGWGFSVVSFDIEPQGFPPGSRGYDGAGVHDGTVIRLTRELAERAFKLALTSTPKRDTHDSDGE